jgi:hypothetical protein
MLPATRCQQAQLGGSIPSSTASPGGGYVTVLHGRALNQPIPDRHVLKRIK